MSLVVANALLLVLVLVELYIIAFHNEEEIPWREVIFNLNSGHILMWVLRGMEIGAFHLVLTHWSINVFENWSYISIWIFGFIAWDFCFYWLHRFHHHYKFLWAVHVIHHEGEHFSLSLGIRNSWYSSITSFPFFIGLAFLGVPLEIFIATSSIHYFIQFYNHNSLVKKSGILEKIMITPSHHKVHHGCNDEYIDRNFGGTFIIWDKLFGTFQPEIDDVPVVVGVKDYDKNHDIVSANNLPFLKLFNLANDRPKKKGPAFKISDGFIASGGIMLFGLLLYYILQENTWHDSLKIYFFGIVFIGTIANGGISEGKFWGLVFWIVNFLCLAPIFILGHQLTDPILIGLLVLLAIHSIISLFKANYNRSPSMVN